MSRATSSLRAAANVLAAGTATVVAIPAAYLAVLTIAGWQRGRTGAPAVGATPPTTRFAVCIPAHDEESTIAAAVAALRRQRYPGELFTVHVVADNCTDGTAEVARRAGAVAHERHTPGARGKGPALNWLFDCLAAADVAEQSFDVVVIVDADTVAEPMFLRELDEAFSRGSAAVQGHYGVRESSSSTSIALRYAALAGRHHLRPLGRAAIGGSSGLYGNGMAFRRELMNTHRWTGHLIEDAEFQLELLMDGIPVDYLPRARIEAEMPDTLEGSQTQNERWELGRIQMVGRFARPLATRAVVGGVLRRRVYADALADLLLPPTSFLAALDVGALVVTTVVARGARSRSAATTVGIAAASSAALAVHVVASLRSVDAPAQVYRSLLAAPRMVLWKLGVLARVARRPGEVGWTRTARNVPHAED